MIENHLRLPNGAEGGFLLHAKRMLAIEHLSEFLWNNKRNLLLFF